MTFYKAWDTWLKVPKSVSLPYCQEKYSHEVPLRYVLCIEFYCDTLKKNHTPEPRLYYAAVSGFQFLWFYRETNQGAHLKKLSFFFSGDGFSIFSTHKRWVLFIKTKDNLAWVIHNFIYSKRDRDVA